MAESAVCPMLMGSKFSTIDVNVALHVHDVCRHLLLLVRHLLLLARHLFLIANIVTTSEALVIASFIVTSSKALVTTSVAPVTRQVRNEQKKCPEIPSALGLPNSLGFSTLAVQINRSKLHRCLKKVIVM